MTTRMDLEDIMLNEISQSEKDKYCMISLTYGIQKQNKTSSWNTEYIFVNARGGGWWVCTMGEGSQKVQSSNYKINVMGM